MCTVYFPYVRVTMDFFNGIVTKHGSTGYQSKLYISWHRKREIEGMLAD